MLVICQVAEVSELPAARDASLLLFLGAALPAGQNHSLSGIERAFCLYQLRLEF